MSTRKPKPENVLRDRIVDAVHVYMHDNYRDSGIDKLLTRPLVALELGVDVGEQVGVISRTQARIIRRHVRQLFTEPAPPTIAAFSEVCRIALSARKRGELRRDRV